MLTGVLIGIFTSLVAGLILLWKGDAIVRVLNHLPIKYRVAINSRAYIKALHGHPYDFMNGSFLGFLIGLIILVTLVYVSISILLYSLGWPDFEELKNLPVTEVTALSGSNRDFLLSPWFFPPITVFSSAYFAKQIYRGIIPNLYVPGASRELDRVRAAVSTFGTKEQYISYLNSEDKADDREDVLNLVLIARELVGDQEFSVLDDIEQHLALPGS